MCNRGQIFIPDDRIKCGLDHDCEHRCCRGTPRVRSRVGLKITPAILRTDENPSVASCACTKLCLTIVCPNFPNFQRKCVSTGERAAVNAQTIKFSTPNGRTPATTTVRHSAAPVLVFGSIYAHLFQHAHSDSSVDCS